jgi:heme/copper-type cytochrome/quinol oxidase subunit 2
MVEEQKIGKEPELKASQNCACWNFGMQSKTIWLLALLVLVVVGAGYAVLAAGNANGAVVPAAAPVVTPAPADAATTTQAEVQDVYVRALGGAHFGTYDKSEITVKKGVPVRLHFSADADAGCGKSLVVYGLNVRLNSPSGSAVVAEFTPQEAGTYEYSCSMRMFGPGKLIVV